MKTAESEERVAKFVTHASAHSTYLINGFIFVTFCVNAFHVYTETYRESPDPSFPVRDTESDPRWGWLDLACETNPRVVPSLWKDLRSRLHIHTIIHVHIPAAVDTY